MLSGQPLCHVYYQKMIDEILGFGRNLIPVLLRIIVFGLHDLFKHLGDALGIERRKTAQQDVRNYSDTPHVDLLIITFSIQNLGCCNCYNKLLVMTDLVGSIQRTNIAWCTTGGLHHLILIDDFRKTEVGDLDFRVILNTLDKKVLGLNTTVRLMNKNRRRLVSNHHTFKSRCAIFCLCK